MKNGVKQIVEQRITWPPNLPKFLELANGVDSEEVYDHLISRGKPRNAVEIKVWGDCAFKCRSIAEDKSRALFKKVYLKWYERNQRGEMPPEGQKALPKISADKNSDHMIEERMRSNKPKTKLELRVEALRNKK